MSESALININRDDSDDDEKMHGNKLKTMISTNHKVDGLERVILISNFILELPSAVFDQLSSVHKPQYALLSMLMSLIVFNICVIDFARKARKEKDRLIFKFSGSFADIVGLICALCQCVFTSIAYWFCSRHADNPIKINIWPIVFSFVLLYFKLPRRVSRRLKPEMKLKEFTLAKLVDATNNFSNLLFEKEFAYVYKGYSSDDSYIEVWRHKSRHELEKNPFENELKTLEKLNNKHVVRLIGYCDEGEDKLLVFEGMENTPLRDLLHDKNCGVINSWKMRIKIALEAAKGIQHLHIHAVPPVIHRDFNSSKVLIDQNGIARVCGFESSLMVPELEHDYEAKIDGKVMQSLGYIDSTCYFNTKKVTAKSDIYSLGVVLLELLTGKLPVSMYDYNVETSGIDGTLVEFAVRKIMANELVAVLDARVGSPKVDEEVAVKLLANIAFGCVKCDVENRPTINDVVVALIEAFSRCD